MKPNVIKQNIGCDLSKDDFKVSFHQLMLDQSRRIKGSRSFNNTLAGFRKFIEWVAKRKADDVVVRITMEATGVYYEQLVHFLNDKTDFHISVALPNKTKAYFKSLNVKSKNDAIDAKILGQMGIERNMDPWKPLSENMRLLKQLSRDRISLLDQKTALSNRLHALKHSYSPHKQVIKRLKEQINLIKYHLKEVESQIKETVEKDNIVKERVDKVCTVKGLGLITVVSIVAETGGFEFFSSRGQLTSYSGYDVVENESGTSIKGKTRISKKGNKYIRRALHFPAMTIVKYDHNFRILYERVFDRTKVKMKGYVAVQRKLLILIYTLFKKNEVYDINYQNKKLVEC